MSRDGRVVSVDGNAIVEATGGAGPSGGEKLQLVTFRLGSEEYGVPITDVQEIIRMRNIRITAIPNAPAFVEGVINLRGRMVPVVDMRARFAMEAVERGREHRIVVLNLQGRTVGIVVDAVIEVVRYTVEGLEQLPDIVTGVDSDYIVGVVRVDERMVIELDIRRMFSEDERASIRALDQVAEGR